MMFLAAACTSPNPRSCKDGTCTDPAFPFCDIDGALAGTPATCLAVTCTEGEVAGCRADTALVCNAAGNDYDLVACEHGCDATAGCLECTASDQCPTSAPVCDTNGTCRACAKDDECASQVCEEGTCVAESGILYASMSGAETAPCTLTAPCTPTKALGQAAAAVTSPIVRILPGVYAVGMSFEQATTNPMTIVATGATFAADVGLSVKEAADVRIRGVALVGVSDAVLCTSSLGAASKLQLTDSTLAGTSDMTFLLAVSNCFASVKATSFEATAIHTAITLGNNANLTADRIHVRGKPTDFSGIAGFLVTRVNLRITNSLLEDAFIDFYTTDTSSPGSSVVFGNNTIVRGTGYFCRTEQTSSTRPAR